MIRAFFNLFMLPDENEEELSECERGVRKTIDRIYRFGIASFFAYHTFDFLFNPIWMHGYVWSLNLPIDLDMADKSAGLIVAHQLKHVTYPERAAHAVLITIFMMLMLWRCGFTAHSQRMSTLISFGIISGLIVMFVRGLQMKQRLFSAIHEGCFTIIVVFTVGISLTIRLPSDSAHRFSTKKMEEIEENETKEVSNLENRELSNLEENMKKTD